MLFPPLKNLNNLCTLDEKLSAIETLKSMVNEISFTPTTTITTITEDYNIMNECVLDFIDNDQIFNNSSITEVDDYLQNTTNFNSKNGLLNFRHENKKRFPNLSVISRRIFTIPATNLSSERNFNYAGLT